MKDQPILRSTARPGDRLFVTGSLGGSLVSGRHLTFEPRLDFAHRLIEHTTINAMMDLSDGLSMDLHRMMAASQTAAILRAYAIPIHSDVPKHLPECQRLNAALGDGEDFELLISVSDSAVASLIRKAVELSIPLYEIGSVTEGSGVRLQDSSGSTSLLAELGWQHGLD